MNNITIVEALSQIAREKNVDREMVVQTLVDALISAAKKRYGNTENYEAEIDATTGKMDVFALRTVVEEVEEPGLQIDLEEAKEIDVQAQLGSVVRERLDFTDFGRNAIQTAKQILVQRVREAERERVFDEFDGRVGQIESGTVQQISHGDIILSLGRAEAAIPYKEQIRRERYRQGDAVRGYIYEVLKSSRGPQVLLSRTHPEFLKKLFAIEVPEIAEGIVEIHGVAREPGERAKIAVSTSDERVDPVGACVGIKGSRVQAIVREMSGERIDIVPWSEEAEIFISRALSPANVSRVIVDRRRKHAMALVEKDQLSLAIGKSGQNSRLAVQLTGWGLDIITEAEYQERRVNVEVNQQAFRQITGVSEMIALSLATSGFSSVAEISETSLEMLQTVPGLEEEDLAGTIREAAQALAEKQADEPEVPVPTQSETDMEVSAGDGEGEVEPAEGDPVEVEQVSADSGGEPSSKESEIPAADQAVPAEIAGEGEEIQGAAEEASE